VLADALPSAIAIDDDALRGEAAKRGWFELNAADVAAFKRRKFM
jgi:hypothetical protein